MRCPVLQSAAERKGAGMNTKAPWAVALVLSLMIAASRPGNGTSSNPGATSTPALINTCLITKDVKRLSSFYAEVLQVEPQKAGENYVEFHAGTAVLALFDADAQEKYIPGAATAGQNRSTILEFRVSDVDREYKRLQSIVKLWVKAPTTQPWGTRSIYFRDPDGNLVDFFTAGAPR
jgi:catechol 2,3-dioxygenase-like lactoylglutathione lyase family enzyme